MPGLNAREDRSLSVVENSSVIESNKIRVTLNGTTVTVEYETIAGNKPELYGNTVWLWPGAVVPFSGPPPAPIDYKPITSNDSHGSISLQGTIQRKDYTAGYSVNDKIIGVCTSGTVAPPTQKLALAPTWVTMSIYSITTSELLIKYETLRGNKPKTYGNWLGLYKGDALPWDADNPYAFARPEDDAQMGIAKFGAPLSSGFTYTVIYYMADEAKKERNASAAALLRFDAS